MMQATTLTVSLLGDLKGYENRLGLMRIFAGDQPVTSLFRRGLNHKERTVSLDDGKLTLRVVSPLLSAGELYESESVKQLRDSSGFMIVFNVTDPDWSWKIANCFAQIQQHASPVSGNIALVGNYPRGFEGEEDMTFSYLDGKQYADGMSERLACRVPYIEVSSSCGRNVEFAFMILAAKIAQ